jgi:hypothetical protein
MESPQERRGIAPWIWVLIVLGALILVFVIWWAVAAQAPKTAVVPQEVKEQAKQPEQPVVVERQQPVNIYIERQQPAQQGPRVIVVPQNQQPPEAIERLRRVDLPSRFRYQGSVWEPSGQAVMGDTTRLRDTGASIDGNIVYVEEGTESPYYQLYLETEPGSGIYIGYLITAESS